MHLKKWKATGGFIVGFVTVLLGFASPPAYSVPLFLDKNIPCSEVCPTPINANKLAVPVADLIKVENPNAAAGAAMLMMPLQRSSVQRLCVQAP